MDIYHLVHFAGAMGTIGLGVGVLFIVAGMFGIRRGGRGRHHG